MSIYHFHVKKLQRGPTKSATKGRCSVQKFCYITASRGQDERTSKIYDNTKKSWEVIYTETFLPEGANPIWKKEPLLMFNEIERLCQNGKEVLAFDIDCSFPLELSEKEMLDVAQKYAKRLTDKGFCVTIAIHNKLDGNPHLHMLVPTRPCLNGQFQVFKVKKVYSLDEDGNKIPIIDPATGEQKVRVRTRVAENGKEYTSTEKLWEREVAEQNPLSYPGRVVEFRKAWADINNEYLSEENKISHLSYREQGINNKIPQKHLSYQVRAMEERGEVTFKGALQKDIQIANADSELMTEERKLQLQKEQLLVQVKNKLQLKVEKTEESILQKIDNGFKKVKSFFLKNINHIKRSIWNSLVPEYGAYSTQEISNDVAIFIKKNSDVNEIYENSFNDEVFSLLKKRKYESVKEYINKCINKKNKIEGEKLIKMIGDLKESDTASELKMTHTMKI